jgi:hypothetical protein
VVSDHRDRGLEGEGVSHSARVWELNCLLAHHATLMKQGAGIEML